MMNGAKIKCLEFDGVQMDKTQDPYEMEVSNELGVDIEAGEKVNVALVNIDDRNEWVIISKNEEAVNAK